MRLVSCTQSKEKRTCLLQLALKLFSSNGGTFKKCNSQRDGRRTMNSAKSRTQIKVLLPPCWRHTTLQQCNVVNSSLCETAPVEMHILRITLAEEFSGFRILITSLFLLDIPPTRRHGFVPIRWCHCTICIRIKNHSVL